MKHTIVLNGCSETFLSQAEEVNGFAAAYLKDSRADKTIIFHCTDRHKPFLIANSPTPSTQLIRLPRYQPEIILRTLEQLEASSNTELYLFPGDFAGSELSPRLAYRLGGSSLIAVNKISRTENALTCHKAVYSNYMQAEFKLSERPYCISLAKGSTDPLPIAVENDVEKDVSEIDIANQEWNNTVLSFKGDQESEPEKACAHIVDYEFVKKEAASGLENANYILVAGRGVKMKEKVDKLHTIAGQLGAELGVSRPVAMSAWAPLNKLIGVSGIMAKPQICITAAVSGAAAFYTGIEKSKLIIAINTDRGAPIIRASDLAIVDDYEKVLDELVQIITEAQCKGDTSL